jgi:Protein of unknown function (DUF2637)
MISWRETVEFVGHIPSGVWVVLAVLNMMMTIGTWSTARRQMHRAGQRLADPGLVSGPAKAKDTALTVAAMIPAGLFWAMVLAGSFHGLVAFGRQVLGWHDGWEYLVPGTLDGVSVTFAFLAFRAVRKQKAPDRCYRVVWGAALASATVNFAYEYAHSGHNLVAGGYLALLSLFGMVMFHEFLDQFEEGTAYIKRANPRFGLRWITWPTNTFCAAVAWHNHPPTEGTPATVLNAIANLNRVRVFKREAREAAVLTRHQRALAETRRRSELAAAQTGVLPPGDAEPQPTAQVDDRKSELALVPATVVAVAIPPDDAELPESEEGRGDPSGAEVRVPATATTVSQWVSTWMQMCTDGDLVLGPLNDDTHARTHYNLSAKQLRNIRNAATSGALRRRAAELAVALPAGYVDRPPATRINGHKLLVASPGTPAPRRG